MTIYPAVLEHPVGIESGADFLKRIAFIFEEPVRSKFGALYLDQLDDPGPEHAWLVQGWLAANEVSVVAGASRSGKSFLALETGLCVAEARPLFGLKVKHGAVVYQAGEGAIGVKKRLRAWRQHHGRVWTRETPFVLLQRPIDIYHSTEEVDSLISEILAHAKVFEDPLRLVVIDTLATATPGADENSGRDMSTVLGNVARISEKCGCHVMLVHHLNAAGGRLRGHTSVYANVGQVILVERDEETGIRTVKLDKQKDDIDGKEMKFELMQVTIGIDEDGEKITSCICLPVGEKDAVRREEELKGFRLNKTQEVFMQAFFDVERRYGQPVPREVSLPVYVRSLAPWEDVKRVYGDMSPSDALTPDQQTTAEAEIADKRWRETMKKRIQRMREDLEALGILGVVRHEGRTFVYWTGKPLRAFPETQPRPRAENDDSEPVADVEF
jgi:RecA/RadA recombinase